MSRNRIVSVCGSADPGALNGYLQYRFGRIGHIEMQYPSMQEGSARQFRFYHYGRYRVERLGLIFRRRNFEYTTYSHYEGDEKPEKTLIGLTVSRDDGRTVSDLRCTLPLVDRLSELEDAVPCDRGNALAMKCPE